MPVMTSPVRLQTDEELRSWDWRADLRAIERSAAWLARQTGTPERTVYSYTNGQRTTSLDWLRKAADVLGRAG
jgi:hypothetical protein